LCQYGENCYRKNEDHFRQYRHPWLDNKPPFSPEKERGKQLQRSTELQQKVLEMTRSESQENNLFEDSDEDSDLEFDNHILDELAEDGVAFEHKMKTRSFLPSCQTRPTPGLSSFISSVPSRKTQILSQSTQETLGIKEDDRLLHLKLRMDKKLENKKTVSLDSLHRRVLSWDYNLIDSDEIKVSLLFMYDTLNSYFRNLLIFVL
jgi:hypothetical protein